ncbi:MULTISPECIES: hypothetical protein [Corynebacterium]|uniref:Uncharacterized protein n=1 Tax=Corynebacterium ihumii TaxID=1232427 RepID=A0ABY7UGB5_9CORY|nr:MULTISPECIES: hypothetical protein [Corynebacterium]WCZ35100.1 hypothetical protein CIHUM_08450 [Corynebacterium ihumii]
MINFDDLDFGEMSHEELAKMRKALQAEEKSRSNVTAERKTEFTSLWKEHRNSIDTLLDALYDDEEQYLAAAKTFRDDAMTKINQLQDEWDKSKNSAKYTNVLESLREYNAESAARSAARKRGAEKRRENAKAQERKANDEK